MANFLTSAQAHVLNGLLDGTSTHEVAGRFGMTRQAVENHMTRLRRHGLLVKQIPVGWSKRDVGLVLRGLAKGEKKLSWVAVMDAPRLNRFDNEPVGWAVFVHIGGPGANGTLDTVFLIPRTLRWITFNQVERYLGPQTDLTAGLTTPAVLVEITQALGYLTDLEAVLPAWAMTEKA
jgi:hypothetical protein